MVQHSEALSIAKAPERHHALLRRGPDMSGSGCAPDMADGCVRHPIGPELPSRLDVMHDQLPVVAADEQEGGFASSGNCGSSMLYLQDRPALLDRPKLVRTVLGPQVNGGLAEKRYLGIGYPPRQGGEASVGRTLGNERAAR